MKTEATLIHHMKADELIKLFTDLQKQISELKLHYEQKKLLNYLQEMKLLNFLNVIYQLFGFGAKKEN